MKKSLIASMLIVSSITISGCGNQKITNNIITLEEAKEIALRNANLNESEVNFINSRLETDNGIKKYDIEFYHENKEYDYEINALDGSIIEYDFDVENYNPQQVQGNSNSNASTVKISQEQAKEIVLKHANLKSDQVKFGKIKLDYDDGVQEYDIEFYYNNKEYSYQMGIHYMDIIGECEKLGDYVVNVVEAHSDVKEKKA